MDIGLTYINTDNIEFVVSKKARARAYARIYGLPRAIQTAHELPALYTIEFICEKTIPLNSERIMMVLIHELLHIPYTTGGGLRPHGKLVNDRKAKSITRKIPFVLKHQLKEILEKCCSKN